jgi:3-hydroxyisobutyrate dehydrogenase-like beta-hydroxyacid dehydrogenase
MPFALIPDGFSLVKVTKAQEKAVSDKRRHDNVVALVNNPEIIKQIIITGTAYLIAKEGKQALLDLKNLGVNISQDVESAYTKKRQFGDAPVGVSIEQLVEATFERLGV